MDVGMTPNADGLYPLEEVVKRLNQALETNDYLRSLCLFPPQRKKIL